MGCFLFHKWGDWEAVPGKCEEKQVCAKCGEEKTRTTHKLSDWNPVTGQCKNERHCVNPWCSYSETRDVPHTYGQWDYYEDGCCTQKRVCSVCGKNDYREKCPDKKEEIEVSGECRVIHRCPRCGIETTESIEHSWLDGRRTMKECLQFRISQNEEISRGTRILPSLNRNNGGDMSENLYQKSRLAGMIAADQERLAHCEPDTSARICQKCFTIQKLGKREP